MVVVLKEGVYHDQNGLHHGKYQEILFNVLWPAEAETWSTSFLFLALKGQVDGGWPPHFLLKVWFSFLMSGISKISDAQCGANFKN